MDLLTFGSISYRPGQAFVSSVSVSSSISKSSSEVLNQKPATQVKGPGLIKVDLTLKLHQSLFHQDILEEHKKWISLQESGQASPLLVGGSQYAQNPMLLAECKLSNPQYGYEGQILSAELSLSFQEYIPAAEVGTAAGGQGGTSPGLVSSGSGVADYYQVQDYTQEEKGKVKRKVSGLVSSLVDRIGQITQGVQS